MSALAHYFEDEGLATTLVGLLRPHVEHIAPPRALWVPFVLGRPLGTPNDAAFQTRVIRAALALLERDDGPVVLEDFGEAAPDHDPDPAWTCPVTLGAADLAGEVEQVRPHHARAVAATGYSTVGLSGFAIEQAAEYLARFDGPDPMPNPRRDLADVQVMRFAADDLKAFYLEAAATGPGRPNARQLADWFWRETIAARTVLALRAGSVASDEEKRAATRGWLVPVAQLEALGLL